MWTLETDLQKSFSKAVTQDSNSNSKTRQFHQFSSTPTTLTDSRPVSSNSTLEVMAKLPLHNPTSGKVLLPQGSRLAGTEGRLPGSGPFGPDSPSASAHLPQVLADPPWSRLTFSFQLPCQLHSPQALDVLKWNFSLFSFSSSFKSKCLSHHHVSQC